MKKSLIALAVLAASGASFAQVSITGNLTAGFQSSNVPKNAIGTDGLVAGAEASSSGFGVDTAEIVFSAKEDLGGGMKASAKLGLVDAARGMTAGRPNTGFGPGDTELGLSGGFGQLTLSSSRGADYLSGGVAGVGGTFMDGRVFGARTSTDAVAYSMPVGPVTVGLSYAEKADTLGLGVGTSGAASATSGRQAAVTVQYAGGPLAADAAYLSDIDVGGKNHYRLSASYDLGVAKLGGGYESQSYDLNAAKSTTADLLVGVSVPMGPVTLGANWAQRQVSETNIAAVDGTNNGYSLKAAYALSKRTSVSADYTSWTGRATASTAPVANAIATDKNSVYNLFLSHSF